ncbi:MAG: tRNA pseudouridine(55) synthase TruB [Planctomycetota bacterium]
MFGLLNINKPSGITSRDVVNKVQRLIRPVKVGHAGTLDPLATGVLVLGLGPATRLTQYVQKMKKSYRGTFLLGRTSDTEDIEGQVTELDAAIPTREQLNAVLPRFLGEIQQKPPAYSALKVAGRRAYDLARAGETVELAARPVTIYDLAIVEYEYPRLVLDIVCGSGTYVRSLGRDVAIAVETGAVMSGLVRTAIGPFSIETAMPADDIALESITERLAPAKLAVADVPATRLNDSQLTEIRHGRLVDCEHDRETPEVAALDSDGNLVAILVPRRGRWGPARNFAGSA